MTCCINDLGRKSLHCYYLHIMKMFHTIRNINVFIPQAILLSDSSSDEDEDPQISEAELHNMLKLHKYQRKHQMQFYQDPEVIH